MTKEQISSAASEQAKKLAEEAGGRAQHHADHFRDSAADQTFSAAEAVSDLEGSLPEGSPQRMLVSELAGALMSYADYLEHADVDDLMSDLSDFARERPRSFLAGAALAGFALARVATVKPEPPHAPDASRASQAPVPAAPAAGTSASEISDGQP